MYNTVEQISCACMQNESKISKNEIKKLKIVKIQMKLTCLPRFIFEGKERDRERERGREREGGRDVERGREGEMQRVRNAE